MADEQTGEYAGKSAKQVAALKRFKSALGYSQDYVRPKFQTAVRMYRLFAGKMPPEIQSTFSQVMLWFPYSIIQRELAGAMKGMLEGSEWLDIEASDFRLEPSADVAKKWLIHQMTKVQKFERTAIPTYQQNYIFGNAYRFYGFQFQHKEHVEQVPIEGPMGIIEGVEDRIVKTEHGIITGQAVNFFNVLPSPNGGVVNPAADTMEAGLDYLIAYMYMPTDFIKNEAAKGNFDKTEAAKCLAKKYTEPAEDPSAEYKNDLADTVGSWNNFTAPEWVDKMRADGSDLPQRRRTAWMFERNRWTIVAEETHVLYDGPPILSFWPVANFRHSPNLSEFFGFSLLEVVEDLLISMSLNFNMRLDYLAGKFHPPQYIPQRLIDDVGGDMGAFDWAPYKTIPYAHTAFPQGLGAYMYKDEMPDLTQQAFMEQGQMQEYLQDIISQHSGDSMNANTATVGSMLGSMDAAPRMLRAITTDMTGLQDCVEQTLRLGSKYKNEDELIRTGAEGLPWEKINHEAITDGYGVMVKGARHLSQAEEVFKKMLSTAPMFLNNPAVRGQVEMSRQLLEGAGFKKVDMILYGEQGELPQAPQQGEQQMPGGIPSLQNESRSTMNRSTRGPGGQQVAAMAAMV